jgi:outer membrane immunogenic protein
MRVFSTAVACLALAGAAHGADLSVFPAAPVPGPAPFNWTGVYLGAMGGFGFGQGRVQGLSGTTDISGGFGGGQVGFNYQPIGTPWVYGVELDGAGARIGRTETTSALGITLNTKTELESFGILRGRVGWTPGPILLYGTGGLAYGTNQLSGSLVAPSILNVSVSDRETHTGWTAGLGAEYALAPKWTVKIEYLYMKLGNKTYFSGIAPFNVNADVNTVKFGFNYLFH